METAAEEVAEEPRLDAFVESDALYVQEGQLMIPLAGRTILLQDGDGNYQQYVINDCPDEKLDESSIVYYDYDDSPEAGQLADADAEPFYQYAVLSNGKLHLQAVDEEEEDDEQMAEIDEPPQPEAVLDLDKITGKNLITGQTVTLDSYFSKLQNKLGTKNVVVRKRSNEENELINKKVVIGKMANGKTIVGKILHVQTNRNVEAVKKEPEEAKPQPHIIIKKHVVTRENFDLNIGKTLAGLMDLETVQHKLRDKDLVVKLVDKVYEFGSENFTKTISYVYGHMETVDDAGGQQKWCFALQNESERAPEQGDLPTKETASLTIVTVVDQNGKKSTRVNLNPQQARNKCHMCTKEFKTAVKLRKHVSNVHLSENWVSCDICDKTFTNTVFLLRHKKMHTGKKWFQCTKCSKSFNSAGSLKRHLTVHDPSLRPLECSVCVQRFTDESSLRKHLLIHTGIRAYLCDVCNRAFRNQGDLNFHRKIHDPVKPFNCEVCGRAFSRHSNMVRHAEIHRGSGALHQCHICGCSYSFISSLTRHIVQKHISEQKG